MSSVGSPSGAKIFCACMACWSSASACTASRRRRCFTARAGFMRRSSGSTSSRRASSTWCYSFSRFSCLRYRRFSWAQRCRCSARYSSAAAAISASASAICTRRIRSAPSSAARSRATIRSDVSHGRNAAGAQPGIRPQPQPSRPARRRFVRDEYARRRHRLRARGLLSDRTFLMGATLPVLSQVFVRSRSHLGQRVGDLYATNTLGAVIGCALAGYYLIPQLGLSSPVYSAAVGNIVIAVIVIILSLAPYGESREEAAAEEAEAAPERCKATEWLLLVSIALSGAAAMVYENAWTHALTLVIGGSVYSFTTMLLTFLVGLAAGGYLYARLFGPQPVSITAFGVIELSVGITAMATIPMFERLPLVFLRLYESFGDTFALFLCIQVALAFAVMFIPALLLGMTFPLVVSLFTQSIYRIGSSVGTTYASNTLGAIVGAFIGGFVLLPLTGIQHSIVIGALLNLAVGGALLIGDVRPGRSLRLAVGGAIAAAVVVFGLRFTYWDPVVMTSGVTVYAKRYKAIPADSLRREEMHRDRLLYYREGLTATISVHETRYKTYRYFKTNGKVDGSYGDALTMLMTGYLPMLLKPDARNAAVIGLGTGMTVKAVGTFPVKNIEVLEIEPAMAEAAAYFGEKNGNILNDPRVRLVPSDGRNYLMAVPRKYDLIISEPSNPWIAGIASLFTRDFYSTARQKLTPDGVFAQWLQNYSMSPDDFRMVLRTFAEAFPHVSVWNLQESDFLLVGSLKEQRFDYARADRKSTRL